MGSTVYANGMSIACKAASGKTIAAMPDVCLSPPTPPAGPVPIPYPNTAMASDTDGGSKTVQIGGQEVMLKDQSTFKTSSGDEAATKSLGMGVVTHQIQGKANFVAWSMDVKFEGQNVPRHLDLMGHNEASSPPNTPPWAYLDSMSAAQVKNCASLKKNVEEKCGKHIRNNTYSTGKVNRSGAMGDMCKDKKCKEANECMLVEYGGSGSPTCCPGTTGHHLVEVHCFSPRGGRKEGKVLDQFKGYDEDKAPVACVTGPRDDKEHGAMHAVQQQLEASHHEASKEWKYKDARDAGVLALSLVKGCDPDCTKAQLDYYHKRKPPNGPGVNENSTLRTDPDAATRSMGELDEEQQAMVDQSVADSLGIGANATS
jgi:Domain of unknown function (DUF4150)/GHH signature containing HNH/Endo VII superfamily nuclease toxin  2